MAMYGTRDDQKCAEVATVLLEHGAEIDPIDAYHATPLMHAVEMKKSQLAGVLLAHGASMSHRFGGATSDSTLLHMAVIDKDKDMVTLLLKYKAPVDAVNRDGATALDLAEQRDETEIAAVLREADPEAAKRTPQYTVPPTKEEMRALGQRIADGDDSAFDELDNTSRKLYGEIKDYQREQARSIVVASRMHAAFNVLGEEAGKGNEKAFAALKKCLTTGRMFGFAQGALGIAAAGGNKDAFDILSHYQEWHLDEFSAKEAIFHAAEANCEPAIDYTANLVSVQNPREFSGGLALEATNALAKAAEKGNQKAKDALQKFFASAPAPATTFVTPQSLLPPRDPNVPAHWGYIIGDKEALDRILASTNLMQSRDDNGQTALEWAVKSHHTDFARMFLEHGAPIPAPLLALDSADPRMNQQMKYEYLKYFNTQHPALLPWTVTHYDKEMTSLLLEFHAPLDAVDQDGNTPLHSAVTAKNKDMVKLLLDAKPALNLTNREGATPLFIAEAAENADIADLIKQAAAARGETVSGANAPSRAEMQTLGQRICDGNMAAIGDLRDTAKEMANGVDFHHPALQHLLGDRMMAAFHLLGEQAGKGNDNAFKALKEFLNEKDILSWFVPDALGIAAAAGNEDALNILIHYRQWGILDSSAYLALQAPAEANRQPAVDAFIALLQDPEAPHKQYYGVAWLAKQVATSAAARGDEKAKAALQEFAANQPELNSQLR
jgi:ankyrin repeat protein